MRCLARGASGKFEFKNSTTHSMSIAASTFPTPPSTAESPEVVARFRYWQTRTLIATMFGYAAFYFVRKNLGIAMPTMQEDLHITKVDLGLFLTLHGCCMACRAL